MATFLTGTTFAVSEQVTNTKLNNCVNLASISSINASELAQDLLTSLPSGAGKIPQQNIWGINNVATNASLITVSLYNSFNLFYSTYGSIATFVGARGGQKFTLISQQASFPALSTLGNFKLSANWSPAKQYDNISLIWTGSVFVEIGRTSV